ncbi:MAG: tyrosine-type recombinase/integrase, partial [Chloroflexi bacterium]|nr:tyrosine-type recombinase/integrase [Chloroflexota bacterium]
MYEAKLLNKLSVSELAVLSKLSKAYISQVKTGKRPVSKKLSNCLRSIQKQDDGISTQKALELFIKSRREGISKNTIRDYRITLSKALLILGLTPKTAQINKFLYSLSCSLGGKYDYFKCIRAFYNWLYSPRASLGYKSEDNPVLWVEAPKRPILILPSLTYDQVKEIIKASDNLRNKTVISLFTESGLRLVELTNITLKDINWTNCTIRV